MTPPPAGEARWESYVDLLRWAKANRLRLVGLDCANQGFSSLQARDQCAAQALAGAWRTQPHAQIWALVGQLHLAPAHLPRTLTQVLGRVRHRPLGALDAQVVFQNCELLYFRLLLQGLTPERRILRLGRRCWSLMHTPPTACQLSFLASLDL